MPRLINLPSMLALLCLLCGCTAGAMMDKANHDRDSAAARPLIAPYIGGTFWTAPLFSRAVCDTATYYNDMGCGRHSGKFTIDDYVGVEQAAYYTKEIRVHVTFADGASGFTGFNVKERLDKYFADHDLHFDPKAYPGFLDHLKGREAAARRKLPGVVFGLTQGEVLETAWGAPLSKHVQKNCYSHESRRHPEREIIECDGMEEDWLYPEGAKLVFAEEGVVEIRR